MFNRLDTFIPEGRVCTDDPILFGTKIRDSFAAMEGTFASSSSLSEECGSKYSCTYSEDDSIEVLSSIALGG